MPEKPWQRLVCLADLEPNQLRLVPLTTKIARPTFCAQPTNVDVRVDDDAFQLQRCIDSTCMSEYRMMRPTPKNGKANTVIASFKVTLSIRADTPIAVLIPCAATSMKVHNGDMLMLYKPFVKAQAKMRPQRE